MQDSVPTKWLRGGAAVVVGFGILTALAAFPATAAPAEYLFDLMFWPIDGAQSLAAPETRLACAIGGGVMVGWGVTIWLVADRLGSRDRALTRMLILPGVGAWFVVDSIGSVVSGAPFNAVLNVGFPLFFGALLWRRARRANG